MISRRRHTDLSSTLAEKFAAIIAEKGDTLVAKVESRESRIARIKKSVKSSPLPSVSVIIGERHFGQPVIDPAAETELNLILKKCGFKLVDDKSPEKADIEITGDAFSALGQVEQMYPAEMSTRSRKSSIWYHLRNFVGWAVPVLVAVMASDQTPETKTS
jgi:hypothetical protein